MELSWSEEPINLDNWRIFGDGLGLRCCPGWCLECVTSHQVLPIHIKGLKSPTVVPFQKMHQKITMIGSEPKNCIIFSDNTSLCFAYILLVLCFFVLSIRWTFFSEWSKHRLFFFRVKKKMRWIRWLKNNTVSASNFFEDALHSLLHSPLMVGPRFFSTFSLAYYLVISLRHSVPYSVNWPLGPSLDLNP